MALNTSLDRYRTKIEVFLVMVLSEPYDRSDWFGYAHTFYCQVVEIHGHLT